MLKIIPTKDNVIALSYSGEITAKDIDESYELITKKFEGDQKISAFFELCDDLDIEAAAIWRDFKRAPELLGKIRQFERVAMVASESWIRAVGKVEELALSFSDIELHVYDEGERDYALAWVKGDVEESHASSVHEFETGDPNLFGFEITGKLRKDDMEFAKQIMDNFTDDNPPRNLIAILKDYHGFELSILADTEMINLKRKTMKHLDRYAIVGAPGWVERFARSFS